MTISRSAHSTPKPPRPLIRSPSDPIHLHDPSQSPDPKGSQQIYVLSADGSSLFLLDPSKPSKNEEPPPYAPFRVPTPGLESSSGESTPDDGPGPSSPRNAIGLISGVPAIVLPEHQRHRASTLSALGEGEHHTTNRRSASRPLMRNHASFSHTLRARARSPIHTHSTRSSPGVVPLPLADERTPLLLQQTGTGIEGDEWVDVSWHHRRGLWKAVFCGEIEEGEEVGGWGDGWRRFWRPVGQGRYWKAMSHLWFMNFPFALAVWPWLVAGTLAGTALLITLPIGAAVWWLTLFLTRSAARLEMIMQTKYHSPLHPSHDQPTYHPIFYRLKGHPSLTIGSAPSSPSTPVGEIALDEQLVWEKRFIKCSYAMFCDHYSYSALCYFLLIKPVIVLFSTILLWGLFPPSAVLVFTLPVYLRAARRWGQWQAGVAVDNL